MKKLTPHNYVYLLTHVVLFLVGALFVTIRPDSQLLQAIGTSIIATGIAGWVVFFYVHVEAAHREDLKRLASLGIVTAFAARSVPIRGEYARRFKQARSRIDFCGFGLRALREDFGTEFESWVRVCKVRILLIDPVAPSLRLPDRTGMVGAWTYADQRDREEGNAPGSIRQDVHRFLETTLILKHNFPDNFDVRLYRCLPSINVCIVDDEAFWGPYVVGQQSRNTPTFLVAAGGTMYNMLSSHFDRIWQDNTMSRPAFLPADEPGSAQGLTRTMWRISDEP